MTFTVTKTKLRTLHRGDPGFQLRDGIMTTGRASIEISTRCPNEHKWIIQQCIENGWIKPVASVYDHELAWDTLSS